MDIDLAGHESTQKVLHVSGYLRFQSAHVPTYPCFPAFEQQGLSMTSTRLQVFIFSADWHYRCTTCFAPMASRQIVLHIEAKVQVSAESVSVFFSLCQYKTRGWFEIDFYFQPYLEK